MTGARPAVSTKFYTGGRRPEVQPLTLLHTSFDRKSTPFESHFVNITNDTPFTYRKLSYLFHSYKIHLLGPSADLNDRHFPILFYKSTSESHTLSHTGILKKAPLWTLKEKKKLAAGRGLFFRPAFYLQDCRVKKKKKKLFLSRVSTEILILGICSFQYFVKDKVI